MTSEPLPIFTVSDFLASVNQTLEYAYPSIEIEGEVSSFKVNQGKYVFFDLKDSNGSVGCFMTVWQLRMPIEDGMKIIVRATAKLTPWGKFSLTVQSFRPSGEGSLKKSFELLKAKLEKEGLFALDRKRPLPTMPGYIGVISSTQAAGYADFTKILDDRWGGMKVDVAHVQVQGEVASDQMIRAINYFNEQEHLPEVLVIIRGGGSADDLASFNDEQLVRTIASSRIPTLVGVGHEVDVTLADMVADVRASTPTNAAQILVPDRQEVVRAVHSRLEYARSKTLHVADILEERVRLGFSRMLGAFERQLDRKESQLSQAKQLLSAYNPEHVFAKGYALVRGDIAVGQSISIDTAKNHIIAEVRNVKKR